MDRSDWLKEKRREAKERYDTLWAPLYGVKWGEYGNATHQQFILKLSKVLPPHCTILDAACGAGRYVPMLLEEGYTVVGIDQSQGMLSRARDKFPNVQFAQVGLQEMSYHEAFDGAICVDAMEHVCPEDWPLVLGNLHRALKPQGYLYLTVEIADEKEIEEAFTRGQELGLPVIYGELAENDVYHYYPSIRQVKEWIQQAGLDSIEEGEGDGYHHLLIRKASFDDHYRILVRPCAKNDPEMTASDVVEIVQLFDQNHIDICIDGGWGVDALLGRQTRAHTDLDIAVQHKDVAQIRALLEVRGYKDVPRDDTRDCNFVLGDDQGHLIDIHTYTFDSAGNLVYGIAYPFDSLNGTGSVTGYPVKCISAEWMVKFHTGYKLDENDYHDVKVLCQRFGIKMPSEYEEFEKKNGDNL